MLPVLVAAPRVVSKGAVKEQRGQENDIEITQEIAKAMKTRRAAPEERAQDLGHIMKVPRHAPPARGQQQGGALLARFSGVGGSDEYRRLSPDGTFAVRGAEYLALAVGPVVDGHADGTGQEEEDGREAGDVLGGMIDQEIGRRGVDGGHPDQAAPADVVAGAVVLDVHGAEVARLPVEELGYVHEL